MHHYFVKLTILVIVLFVINRSLQVSVILPDWLVTSRTPRWVAALVEVFEAEGWTLIPAILLALVWQLAETR